MRDGIVATIQTPLARLGFDSNRSGIGMRSLDRIAAWMSAIVGSCVDSSRNAPASVENAESAGAIASNAAKFKEINRQFMWDLPTQQMRVPHRFGNFMMPPPITMKLHHSHLHLEGLQRLLTVKAVADADMF
jgi:hypothetical protein